MGDGLCVSIRPNGCLPVDHVLFRPILVLFLPDQLHSHTRRVRGALLRFGVLLVLVHPCRSYFLGSCLANGGRVVVGCVGVVLIVPDGQY